MRRHGFLRMLKIAAIAIVAVTGFTFIVMQLWNVLVPGIFGLHAITFWQALGLLVLSKLLFGGFRPHFAGPQWRRRMLERWERMTPEEREKFKQGMRGRCRRGPIAEPPIEQAGARA